MKISPLSSKLSSGQCSKAAFVWRHYQSEKVNGGWSFETSRRFREIR